MGVEYHLYHHGSRRFLCLGKRRGASLYQRKDGDIVAFITDCGDGEISIVPDSHDMPEGDWLEVLSRVFPGTETCTPPDEMRPAEAADIVPGAELWYPRHEEWHIVLEVHHPSDPWKAFSATDGDRYGLDGAFVEVK